MKKKFMAILLCICTLISIVPTGALAQPSNQPVLYGDADGNGIINLEDVLLIERYINGENTLSINLENSDINADGILDETDSQLLREYLVDNTDSLTPELCTITFDTDGGGEIFQIQVGKGYTLKSEVPTPNKEGFIFVNWTLPNAEPYYQHEYIINSDITLKANYEPIAIRQTLNITSFSLDNQSPNVSFDIKGNFGSAEEVAANIIVLPKDGSDPVETTVISNGAGTYTVYATYGFNPGASYELTLGDGLVFADKDEMFRTVYFIIRREESDNLKYNPNLIFIKDTEEMKYTIDGKIYEVLESALLSNEGGTAVIQGTFPMSNSSLNIGDVVCIYEKTHPNDRDYTNDANNSYDNDALAYIRITTRNGIIHGFESLNEKDIDEVLSLPDTIAYKVDTLPTAKGSVNKNDYDAYARTMLGKTNAPEFNLDDFLVFYTGEFDTLLKNGDAANVVYGQITSLNGDIVYYKIIDKKDIENYTGMFITQEISNSKILEGLNQTNLLSGIEKQAEESGFIEEAADYMVRSALQTEDVQKKLLNSGVSSNDITELLATPNLLAADGGSGGGGRTKLNVEDKKVSASFSKGKRFNEGIGIVLNVCLTLSIDTKISSTETISLKIELNAGFEQEVALGYEVTIEDKWNFIILEDLDVTVALDIQSYSCVSVGAKMYTVSKEEEAGWKALIDTYTGPKAKSEIKEAIKKIDTLAVQAKKLKAQGEESKEILEKIEEYKKQLPSVNIDGKEYTLEQLEEALGAEDVSSAFEDVFSAKDKPESKVGLERLMDRYNEMLNQESDWVEVVDLTIIDNLRINVKVIEIKINLDFIINGNVNIAIGADLEYQVGKRYTFWIHIFDKQSGSSEFDLIDERFAFQFYVMGTLGLKVGIKVAIDIGIFSTSIASVGANVEFGPYLKLYGYFIYIYEKLRPANTSSWNVSEEMMGALYLEFGLYLVAKFKAQALEDTIKYEPTIYDQEFPLVTAGIRQNVYDFALEPSSDDILYIDDDDADSTNGITMQLPESYLNMKTMDLVNGQRKQKTYSIENFLVSFNDSRFSIDKKGKISVNVPDGVRYMKTDMRIVWKDDKLALSKYDTDITVPVIWTNMTTTERSEKFNVSVAVGNIIDGYTTVWNNRYSRLDTFDLPAEEEILKLINYEAYNWGNENLKYSYVRGYSEPTVGLSITSDKVYFFDVTEKTYTITVNGIHNTNGTTRSNTYEAVYGDSFNLQELQNTGKDKQTTNEYTSFNNLTDSKGEVYSLNTVVDLSYISKYGTNTELKANYLDNALTATYSFIGIGDVEPVEVKFKARTTPYFEGMNDYVREKGGDSARVINVSPVVTKTEHSINYVVTCEVTAPVPIYNLSFNLNGGDSQPIKEQQYSEGSIVFKPTDPQRTGYTFDGWFSDSTLSDVFVFEEDRMPGNDIILYAKWKANTYTLSFYTAFDKNNAPKQRSIAYNSSYDDLPVLSDETYKFLGWYTEATAGNEITSETLFKYTENKTIYAHWEEKTVFNKSWIICTPGQTTNYDNTAREVAFSLPDPYKSLKDSIVVEYKKQGSNTWTKAKPINAGTYDVKFTRPYDNDYKTMEELFVDGAVVIKKIPIISGGGNLQAPTVYTRKDSGSVSVGRPAGILGDGKITYKLSGTSDGSFTIDIDKTSDTGFFTDLPAGYYKAVVIVNEGTNYNAAESNSKGFNIDGCKSGTYSADFIINVSDRTMSQLNAALYVDQSAQGGSEFTTTPEPDLKINTAGITCWKGEKTFRIAENLVPWQISGGYIFRDDDWWADTDKKLSFTSKFEISYGQKIFTRDFVSVENLEGTKHWERKKEYLFKRTITDAVLLTKNIGNINLSSTTNYNYSYDCTIKDQFMGSYNPMDYYGSPTFTVSSGNQVYDRFIIYTGLTSFEIDTKGLSDYLKKFGGATPKYTITLEYPSNTVSTINGVNTNKLTATIEAINVPAQEQQFALLNQNFGSSVGATNFIETAPHYAASANVNDIMPMMLCIADSSTAEATTLAMTKSNKMEPMLLSTVKSTKTATISIAADDIILNRGKFFDIPVKISGGVSLWGVLAGINYDTESLELIGATAGDIFNGNQFTMQNDLSKATYKFLATRDAIDTINADGIFITLRFKVKNTAEEKSTQIGISFAEAVNATSAVPLEKCTGSNVIVDNTAPKIVGDVDGKTFCGPTEFIVDDLNIDTVTVNGKLVSLANNKFTVFPSSNTITIVLTDKGGNTTTVKVKINVTHSFGDYISDNNASCTKDGTKTATCKVCGMTDTVTDTGSMLEHKWDSGKIIKEATYTKEGVIVYTCTVCGETREEVIPKKTNDHPKTGDSNNMILWIALLFISSAALITLAVKIKKRSKVVK